MTMTVLFILVPIIACVLLVLNLLLAPSNPDAQKVSPYECGFEPINAQTRNPFSISYWLVAVLFLIFDLEIALFYPLAVSLNTVGLYGFWIGFIFVGVLTVGFVYEWGKGSLKFTDHRSEITRVTIEREED